MSDYLFEHGGQKVIARPSRDGTVLVGEPGQPVSILRTGACTFQVTSNGQTTSAVAARVGAAWHVIVGGRLFELEPRSERDRLISSFSGSAGGGGAVLEVRAPMPSRIVRIEVKEGDSVTVGQGLIVVEAMKMENTLKSPRNGSVASVAVTEGKAVEKGTLLIVLK
jgi:pyruvate carboxylase subunit B